MAYSQAKKFPKLISVELKGWTGRKKSRDMEGREEWRTLLPLVSTDFQNLYMLLLGAVRADFTPLFIVLRNRADTGY